MLPTNVVFATRHSLGEMSCYDTDYRILVQRVSTPANIARSGELPMVLHVRIASLNTYGTIITSRIRHDTPPPIQGMILNSQVFAAMPQRRMYPIPITA
jgi:hypothetical protein